MAFILRTDPNRHEYDYVDFVLSLLGEGAAGCKIENIYLNQAENQLSITYIKGGVRLSKAFTIFEGTTIPEPASSVVEETVFGQAKAVGAGAKYAREDHTHGTPVNPVPAHESSGDPHTGYLREADGSINSFSEKTLPVADDILLLEDSEASYAKKKVKASKVTGGLGSVNEVAIAGHDLDDDKPAPQIGAVNVKWQKDAGGDLSGEIILGANLMEAARKAPLTLHDHLRASESYPFSLAAIGTGTYAQLGTSEQDHPGVVSATGGGVAVDGAACSTEVTYIIKGGEVIDCVFKTPSAFSVRVFFFGVRSSITGATQGVYCTFVASSSFSGATLKDGSSSATGTTYTMSVNTWYRGRIAVNSDASRIDFYLYNMSGTELWTDYLTTNIPTADLLLCWAGYITDTSVVTAVYVDLISMGYDVTKRPLVR